MIEALDFAERAWKLSGRPEADAAERGQTGFVRARALWANGRRAQAVAAAEEASGALSDAPGTQENKRREVERWLASHRR